ncbi:MAG: Ig-like domain-containing protein [Synergistaceae bacterium]|nr:Ig-like domain-containing protein [Synergistaceae bacterium]
MSQDNATDNTAVATVDSSGLITPVAAGKATITLTDGNTPGTWGWTDAMTASVASVRTNTFKANFTPTDTTYYNGKANVATAPTIGWVHVHRPYSNEFEREYADGKADNPDEERLRH